MKAIVEFLSGIGDAIVKVWEFALALFRDFMQFLELLTKMPEILAKVLSWIPGEIWISLSLLFGIVILYKIIGREG